MTRLNTHNRGQINQADRFVTAELEVRLSAASTMWPRPRGASAHDHAAV